MYKDKDKMRTKEEVLRRRMLWRGCTDKKSF